MNTGQMLMVLGALVLLSLVALSINAMLVNKTTTMLEVESHLDAISLGQSMLDEILTKPYDAVVANGVTKIFDSSGFTASGGLGPSGAEGSSVPLPEPPDTAVAFKSLKYYNDVDDYNGYKRLAYTNALGTFSIIDTVYYVSETDPRVRSTPQTFFKKIVVTIRHPNMYPSNVPYSQWTGKYYLQVTDISVYRRYF
jgi:hypothetical protein